MPVPRDLAVRAQPGPARGRAAAREAAGALRGRAGQRRGLAARAASPTARCRCAPGPETQRRGDQVLHRLARGDRAARRRAGRGTRSSLRRAGRARRTQLARAWELDWSAAIEPLRDGHQPVRGRPRRWASASRRKRRSSSRKPAACTPRRSAPRRCATGRWRWSGRVSRCSLFAQHDETRAGVEAARRRARRRAAPTCCSPAPRSPGTTALPTLAAASGDRADAARSQSFYRARQRARARARPRSGPPAAPAQGDRDRLMTIALVNGRVLARRRLRRRPRRAGRRRPHRRRRRRRRSALPRAPSGTTSAAHLLLPGFIDTQVNGGGGVLFNDEPTVDAIRAIGARTAASARPASCRRSSATTSTSSRARIAAVRAAIEARRARRARHPHRGPVPQRGAQGRARSGEVARARRERDRRC